ncbi:MAG: bifunctional pyr operon transcriptional regulator/uracil phosphoribosyltransferase PyrR [Candidatus Neomarinimicrobiota bacterium]
MVAKKSRKSMDAVAVGRSITRLAHEILEANAGAENLVLIGILTRGVPLARRLQVLMKKISGTQVPLGTVDITFHRDDFRDRLVVPQIKGTDIQFNLDHKTIILIDDVLYTGRTIRAALDALNAFGRPRAVQLAVLVDRGHREMPVRADYIGKNIPTHEGEHVKVLLKEVDGMDLVRLINYEEKS